MSYFVLINSRFRDTSFAYGEERQIDYNTGSSQFCSECGNPISMLEWLPPFDVTVSKKTLGDFIFGTYVGLIISERVKDLFSESDLRGMFRFRSVDLYFRGKQLIERYYYPEIKIINAFVDSTRIVLEDGMTCSKCQKGNTILKKIDGINFENPDQITEDIFFTTAIGQSTIIISEKFKDFIKRNEFTNASFIQASDYKWDSLKV